MLGSDDQNRIEVGLKICRYAYPEAEHSGGVGDIQSTKLIYFPFLQSVGTLNLHVSTCWQPVNQRERLGVIRSYRAALSTYSITSINKGHLFLTIAHQRVPPLGVGKVYI